MRLTCDCVELCGHDVLRKRARHDLEIVSISISICGEAPRADRSAPLAGGPRPFVRVSAGMTGMAEAGQALAGEFHNGNGRLRWFDERAANDLQTAANGFDGLPPSQPFPLTSTTSSSSFYFFLNIHAASIPDGRHDRYTCRHTITHQRLRGSFHTALNKAFLQIASESPRHTQLAHTSVTFPNHSLNKTSVASQTIVQVSLSFATHPGSQDLAHRPQRLDRR